MESQEELPCPSIIPFFVWKSARSRNEYFSSFLKNLLLALWTFFCFLWCSFFVVLVDSNLPPLEKYGYGLPDIVFDHFSYRQWMLSLSEKILSFFGLAMVMLILFHQYRGLILRRFSLIIGTLYLMRSFSMWITRLPVPSEFSLQCYDTYDQGRTSIWASFYYAVQLIFFMGIEGDTGVVSCGDLIYSGHTTSAICAALFLWKYSNFNNLFVRIIQGIVMVSALFAILSALILSRIHYSIDVYLAVVVTFLYFQYYHLNVRKVQEDRETLPTSLKRESSLLDYPLIPWFRTFETFEVVETNFQWPWKNIPLEYNSSNK